jgi:hypothetical protein
MVKVGHAGIANSLFAPPCNLKEFYGVKQGSRLASGRVFVPTSRLSFAHFERCVAEYKNLHSAAFGETFKLRASDIL